MKKFSTLAFMAFFFCLNSMAQVVLGEINFSLGEGKKINPITGKIIVTFPNVTGVEDVTATNFVLAGNFGESEDLQFDGVGGTFASGVTLDLADFELQPSTDYTLKITSVKVDDAELAPAEGYTLNFKTRSAERKMSWAFNIDDASMAQIVAEAAANADGDVSKFIDITKNGNARYYVPARNYEEILLPDGTALPQTEDLVFKFGEKSFYVSGHTGGWADAICFNNNNQIMVIPDCKAGDVITLNALYSSKNKGWIQAMNGCAIANEGLVSTVTGIQDSIRTGASAANYKFEIQVDGDAQFKFGNTILRSINIEEAQEKVARNYNIVAQYKAEDADAVVLKELVAMTEGMTGSTIKVNYPYWLTDAEGNAYTYGSKGNPFEEAFDLKNGEGDTTFVINYKKTAYEGVVFLSEGEDLSGAALCTSANAAIRSSMAKAAYFAEDVKLCTLQPGTYKIRAVLFDANKTAGYLCTLTKGEGEENEIYLTATATNFDEQESDLLEITEATDITLKASGGENTGIDVIMIYASTDAPDDPDGIAEVKANVQNASARKMVKNGQLLIETAAGTFNALGVQVK